MTLSLIVAMADDQVIGRAGGLPWHLPADLAHFKKITMGHALVMGRRTYASIGRPLPGRQTIVLTRQPGLRLGAGVTVAASLNEGLQRADRDRQIFVVGGAEVYRLALPLCGRMYVTRVHARIAGDVRFPDFDDRQWQLIEETFCAADERNRFPFSFQVFARPTPGRSERP
jgi:dihydrofolate reductase